ncbi:hypothetical protein BJ138DRAFT_1090791 [Hygrophoropsis aurantiaca]|uniref:Uncharacterized protein n=1 Tax=Hygrophoropsis aurantiaca TaxID=72124 RepID=A0ACB8A5P3_9AGAM|nr:hypothetical protein BJ138DRAFT_1090791 [Hygrophoropsis aurantiaca]
MTVSTVSAGLDYFTLPADGTRPYINTHPDPQTGIRGRNWTPKEHPVEIENIREKEDEYTLDTAGFQYYKRPSKHITFSNDAEIKEEYYPESIALIQELTGASKVVLFDHTIRRHRPSEIETDETNRQPVSEVHVDQTSASATARVHRHLPADEANELVKKRFQIINLWRPIHHPAIDYPLTLCDYRSVDITEDLTPVALLYPDRQGETLGVKYNPNHKWKYQKDMAQSEIVLIKCFDSLQDGSVAILTPHTGFKDKTTPKDAPLRESIELRALVFYS